MVRILLIPKYVFKESYTHFFSYEFHCRNGNNETDIERQTTEHFLDSDKEYFINRLKQ
jgi:hypothetical protein